MARKITERPLPGAAGTEERDYEIRSRKVARQAAAEGMVLLRNEREVLPLDPEEPVALYGAGAVKTVKGGTGSGDVNARETVSIREGLRNAGFRITTESWLSRYEEEYDSARAAWRDSLWRRAEEGAQGGEDGGMGFFLLYASTPFEIPAGTPPESKEEDDTAGTAVFVLSRTAGEGSDRKNEPGDYLITEDERKLLYAVCSLYDEVVLVLNTGGVMDLGFLDEPECNNIDGILYIQQPGMEAGNAFADVVSGKVAPSGKLTDTWALDYEDYPNAKNFFYRSGNAEKEIYDEGIYVGYRYFDTFEIPVRYSFGYGLSYTRFSIREIGITHYDLGTDHPELGIRVSVTNTGARSGREVVQVYASCPQEKEDREFRRLAGYAKTACLAPGESQELEIRFPLYQLAAYDENLPGWTLDQGKYILMLGDSMEGSEAAGVLTAEQELVFFRTEHICPLQEDVDELAQDADEAAYVQDRRERLLSEAKRKGKPEVSVHTGDVVGKTISYDDGALDPLIRDALQLADSLTVEQLVELVAGDVTKGQGMSREEGDSQLGSAGISVPGSAGQTSGCAQEEGVPAIVLADGPAGLRLSRSYQVVDGVPQPVSLLDAMEGGYLLEGRESGEKKGETRWQFCTAFPAGTELAQSWDPDLIRSVGSAVGEELREFGVTLWLAPGMNIHRNPLCGRNFEYYSEDPLISGLCAAAMTEGVQSAGGVGTTIKHFACNNQEDNRMGRDSIVSERTLREIYLKGFEICVKKSQPMAMMTSYNLVNGVHAANSHDLCTKAARNEWGFRGVIMTDWTTTLVGPDCTASGCIRAGNDLIMPGDRADHMDIRKALNLGTLSLEDLKRSAARVIHTAWKSDFSE